MMPERGNMDGVLVQKYCYGGIHITAPNIAVAQEEDEEDRRIKQVSPCSIFQFDL